MLKEEILLRSFMRGNLPKYVYSYGREVPSKPLAFKIVRELVKAVREDAIRVMRNNCLAEDGESCDECDRQARAIRRK